MRCKSVAAGQPAGLDPEPVRVRFALHPHTTRRAPTTRPAGWPSYHGWPATT